MPINYYPFEVLPLNYEYDALEPYIDTKTMLYHHDKHLTGYVTNLNKALENYPKLKNFSLEKILSSSYLIPYKSNSAVMRNAGGVYNHNFFFNNLIPYSEENIIYGNLSNAITAQFGSYDNFKSKFKKMALEVFGSGWLWLVKNFNNTLIILPTPNQETPISFGYYPILVIDLWEHAYYLKNQNRRNEYIDDWFNVINWTDAEQNFNPIK